MPILRPSGSDFTSFVKAAAQYVPAGGGGKVSKSGGVSVALPGLGAIVRTSQVGALASPTTSAVVINGVTPPASGGGGPPAFSPASATVPLVLWLAGNNGLNTSTSRWTDPNTTTQYTISGTSSTVTVNGLNACELAAASGFLNTPLTFTGAGRSVFIVLRHPSAVTTGHLYMFSGYFAGGNNVFDFRLSPISATIAVLHDTYQGVGSAGTSSNFTQIIGTPVLYSTVVTSSNVIYYLNGTSIGTTINNSGWGAVTAAPQQVNGFNAIASQGGPTVYCEVLVYNGSIGAIDLSNVTNYLRTKWGTA